MIEDPNQPQESTEKVEETSNTSNSTVTESQSEIEDNSTSIANESTATSETETVAEGNNISAELSSEDVEDIQQANAALQEQLKQEKEQKDALKSQYVRIAADFDNFRKRTSNEKEELESQVKRKTIEEILPIVDNFERARSQIKPSNDGEMGIHKSYQGVYKNLVDTLKRLGVSAMRPEGQPFDPNFHEALLQEQTNEYPEGTVIEQLVRGYLLGERVLRHAKVKVSIASEDMAASEEEEAISEENQANIQEN
ncbi:MAG: nucleotide exchange factor GrpE [Prochloraceae cyanobacterium]|nr:nucleotide exchange factor GrpE [Prochloraceae cyanobacterium]